MERIDGGGLSQYLCDYITKQIAIIQIEGLKARRDHAFNYVMNTDMQIEGELLGKQIAAIEEGITTLNIRMKEAEEHGDR